jgi:hypothetical protein
MFANYYHHRTRGPVLALHHKMLQGGPQAKYS